MFDWFNSPKSKVVPSASPTYSHSVSSSLDSFSFDKVKAFAESDGSIRLDFNGTFITVSAYARHAFLEKIEKVVDMADVADPDNQL